jgi:hypothetical protein
MRPTSEFGTNRTTSDVCSSVAIGGTFALSPIPTGLSGTRVLQQAQPKRGPRDRDLSGYLTLSDRR